MNEIYTSEYKILDRFGIKDEAAVALLLAAGYKSVAEARDCLGRQLAFHIALLMLVGELKQSLDESRALLLLPKTKKGE
jgi:hypothetical protein